MLLLRSVEWQLHVKLKPLTTCLKGEWEFENFRFVHLYLLKLMHKQAAAVSYFIFCISYLIILRRVALQLADSQGALR